MKSRLHSVRALSVETASSHSAYLLPLAMGGLMAAAAAQAQEAPAIKPEREMPQVEVQAQSLDVRVYDRAQMDATPQSNRDISSLIADHPAVRQNLSADSAGDRGSLAPENFSIHGESPYQNQFQIDGISSTNVVSPHVSEQGAAFGRVQGFSQAYNLDTELLEQVQVHDSKVPVEFGHFTGGVVDARIKTPHGTNTWKVKRSFNSSNLTQQEVADSIREKWENGEAGYSPVWKKHFTSVQGDVRVTEDTTALLSFSRRTSEIERQRKVLDLDAPQANGKTSLLETQRSSDRVDNALAKFHTHWSADTETNLTLKYADRQQDVVSNTYANSAWSNQQQSYGLAWDISHKLDAGTLTAKLGWDQMDAKRTADSSVWATQSFEDKNLSSYTFGSFGNEDLAQRQRAAKLRMDWNTLQWGSVKHKFYAGADVQSTRAHFERLEDAYSYQTKLMRNGTQSVTSKTLYMAGTAQASYNTLGLYASDTMQWNRWAWTVAGRVDRDDLFKNTNFAPRTRLDWDLQGNGSTMISAGWSRYFGMDMLGYALEHEKSLLKRSLIDNKGKATDTNAPEQHSYDGVRTPYADEWAVSLAQQLPAGLEGGISYVRRNSRDSITRDGNSTKGYFYNNAGRGQSETVTLSLLSTRPWKAAGAQWTARADWSWQDTWRNHDTLDGWTTEEEEPDSMVVLNGQNILRKDMPSTQFNQPRRLSVSWQAQWQASGVSWGNRVQWNSSRDGISYIDNRGPNGANRYASQTLPSYMTWDTSLTWKPQAARGLTLNVEVLNVLNKIAPVGASSSTARDNTRYLTGREIWLNVGYEF